MRRAIPAVLLAMAACGKPAEKPRAERQLEELYRPLLALVLESRASVEGFLKELGRDYIHPPGGAELQGEEREKWLKKAEGDLMPRNERMCALIRGKKDLVEGEMPSSWTDLLAHQDAWRAAHEKWKKDGVPYGLKAPAPWPRSLERDLRADIAKLEARLPKP